MSSYSGFAQQCQWLKTVSVSPPSLGVVSEITTSLYTNTNGEIYAAGGVASDSGTVQFGNNFYSVWNTVSPRFLMLKYKTDGTLLWSKSTPYDGDSNGVCSGGKIVEDDSGNVIMLGRYKSLKLIFDNDTLRSSRFGTDGVTGFIAKFDENGNTKWTTQIVGDSLFGFVTGYNEIDFDSQGNIYVSGGFSGRYAVFENDTIWNCNQTTTYFDFFIAKYFPNGHLAWVKQAGGLFDDGNIAMKIYDGQIYIAGHSQSLTCTFGNLTVSSNSPLFAYFAKFDTSGNVKWVKTFDDVVIRDIKKGSHGDFYFTGSFEPSYVVLETDTVFMSINNSHSQSYIAKIDTSGHIIWAKQTGIGGSSGQTLFLDNKGRLITAGHYLIYPFICGNDTLNYNVNPSGFDYLDGYVAIFDTVAGNPVKAFRISGQKDDYISGLSAYNDSLYITGNFTSPFIDFGGCQANLQSPMCRDWYLVKYLLPPTGIDEFGEKEQATVYPNPFTDEINIHNPKSYGISFNLHDALGKLILTKSLKKENETIQLSSLPQGMYYYNIYDKDGTRLGFGKLVK